MLINGQLMNKNIMSCYLRSDNSNIYAGPRSDIIIRDHAIILKSRKGAPKLYYIVNNDIIIYYINSGNQYRAVIT